MIKSIEDPKNRPTLNDAALAVITEAARETGQDPIKLAEQVAQIEVLGHNDEKIAVITPGFVFDVKPE